MNTLSYDSREERRFIRLAPDLVRARQLLFDLVWKDLRVRYRYAALGFLWTIIEPLAFTLILTFVFAFVLADRAAAVRSDAGPPYAVMLLCGLIFWQHFTVSLSTATTSLVVNKNLLKKVRFTREVIPIAACCMPLVQLGVGFVLLLVAHLLLGGGIGMSLVYLPMLFCIQFALTVGLALFLACGHVHFRDVGNLVNVLLLFGFYATPIFYPLELVSDTGLPAWLYTAYRANPMAGLVTAYRQALFEQRFPDIILIAWPLCCAVAALLFGAWVFRRYAATMADYL
ncbi:MAG: Teichoic acid translocation permease protein TagG [Candidatus Hydrogenedentes bacterium ADurb.Bin101]|nr:MAG: Teichoic acid translocation permease protein TagG [Candidatus Hydrogenedentes bacterium ADurb.Bin101]HOC68987.1 ABC transporter permease [Candidatus Hydrogenedentota bacterium]